MPEDDRRRMRTQWRLHKFVWKISGGRLGRRVIGMPVLELETIGWKSGEPRQILITYVDSEGAPAIIGTNAGRDVDPSWAKNLRANPQARARWDGKWRSVVATELDGDAHRAAWETAVAVNDSYAEYLEVLARPVPIFRLGPS